MSIKSSGPKDFEVNFNFKIREWEEDGKFYISVRLNTTDNGFLALSDMTSIGEKSLPFDTWEARHNWKHESFIHKLYFFPLQGEVFPNWYPDESKLHLKDRYR